MPEFADQPTTAADDAPPERHLEREGQHLRAAAAVFAIALLISFFVLLPERWGAQELARGLALVSTLIAGLVFAYKLAQLLVDEPVVEVARVLRGERLAVRTEARFLDRLRHECHDGQLRARNRAFSLAVIALPATASAAECAERIPALTTSVRACIRARDVLARIGPDEIWILAPGAGAAAAQALVDRLARHLAPPRSAEPVLRIGWSTFDPVNNTPDGLLEAARSRAGIIRLDDASAAAAA
jgi:GGDEF domain-containing protein